MAAPNYLAFLSIVTVLFMTPFASSIVTTSYKLDVDYSGSSFFKGFDFFTEADYTNGFVTYVDQSTASVQNLISAPASGPVYIGVDNTTYLSTRGAGRNSVRISSQKSWTHGLFILDLAHMPGSICGVWPAFWLVGSDWPNTGEVDIIEGVNSGADNLMSLHSNANCSINSTTSSQTGRQEHTNCDVDINAGGNTGCGVAANDPNSYGTGFNTIGGGVYATEWTSEYIRIWFFPRTRIPADIASGQPNPSLWGLPTANLAGSCDMDSHFSNHQIIFDTTFCGDWAGAPGVWNTDAVCKPQASTCKQYVANNPAAFTEAYWSINYLRVFKLATSTVTETSTSVVTRSSSSSTEKPNSSSARLSSSAGLGSSISSIPSVTKSTSSSQPVPTSTTRTTSTQISRSSILSSSSSSPRLPSSSSYRSESPSITRSTLTTISTKAPTSTRQVESSRVLSTSSLKSTESPIYICGAPPSFKKEQVLTRSSSKRTSTSATTTTKKRQRKKGPKGMMPSAK